VLIGYMRVSKAEGSQTLDLQRHALLAARCSPPASNRGTSTRTRRPANAIIGSTAVRSPAFSSLHRLLLLLSQAPADLLPKR
jgi:hypothetical protein